MGQNETKGMSGGEEIAPVPENHFERCDGCPLRSGAVAVAKEGLDMITRRVCAIEQRCMTKPVNCLDAISSKVPNKVFWPIVTIFVVITGSVIGFSLSSHKEYQRDHNSIHQQMETEKKRVNSEIIEKVNEIHTDIAVIKTEIKNGGR